MTINIFLLNIYHNLNTYTEFVFPKTHIFTHGQESVKFVSFISAENITT